MDLLTIEICAGVGMLGEGLRAGLAHLGATHRTVCYLEREAYAASVLAARMEDGSLDGAPVWPDLLTFDAAAWRGSVDCIAAGFPCQDLSLAGRRAGLDGARSGLFFNIVDIADACGAWCLFLENVSGIASATASVVDEAEGALDERAAARVLGELADRGWHAEWITISASDVGASHGRARWFCFAWRQLDDTGRMQWRAGYEQGGPGSAEASGHEAHHGATNRSSDVAHAQRAERRAQCVGGTGSQQGYDTAGRQAHDRPECTDEVLADPTSGHQGEQPRPDQRGLSQPDGGTAFDMADAQCLQPEQHAGQCTRPREAQGAGPSSELAGCSGLLADAGRARWQGDQLCRSHEPDGRTDGAGIMPTNCPILS